MVSTGYGYVLSNPGLCKQESLLALVSLLSYVAVLWSSWYLAALGYAFRFLQNTQHCIEHRLEWTTYTPRPVDGRMTGQPPQRITPGDVFWLLPSIYHAHAAGLCAFLVIICVAFWRASRTWWPRSSITIGAIAVLIGVALILWVNLYYVRKFRDKWRDPRGPQTSATTPTVSVTATSP